MDHRKREFPADDPVRLDSFVRNRESTPSQGSSSRKFQVFLPTGPRLLSAKGTPNLSSL
jgi:hypothetical protein